MAVEIFKTNVTNRKHADMLLRLLKNKLPKLNCNFDLEDCDLILRIKAKRICPEQIAELLKEAGFICHRLL